MRREFRRMHEQRGLDRSRRAARWLPSRARPPLTTMLELLSSSETWIAFLTLAGLEIVLGIDNIVFISILTGKLPKERQSSARRIGLLLAMGMRVLLLLAITWVMGLTKVLFSPFGHDLSGRDLILLVGGLFLVGKATWEIHDKLEGGGEHGPGGRAAASFASVIVQILLLDLVFSLDSVITAVGMVNQIEIMIAAVVIAAVVMVFTAGPLGNFVERHPTIKMLALSFLLLIGFTLVVEGLHQHIPKGYIYFAMGFSVLVEMLNLQLAKRGAAVRPVNLRDAYKASELAAVTAPVGVAPAIVPVKSTTKKKPATRKKKSK